MTITGPVAHQQLLRAYANKKAKLDAIRSDVSKDKNQKDKLEKQREQYHTRYVESASINHSDLAANKTRSTPTLRAAS